MLCCMQAGRRFAHLRPQPTIPDLHPLQVSLALCCLLASAASRYLTNTPLILALQVSLALLESTGICRAVAQLRTHRNRDVAVSNSMQRGAAMGSPDDMPWDAFILCKTRNMALLYKIAMEMLCPCNFPLTLAVCRGGYCAALAHLRRGHFAAGYCRAGTAGVTGARHRTRSSMAGRQPAVACKLDPRHFMSCD